MEAIVYFDAETGKVISVSNSLGEFDYPYITVDYSEVEKIFTGHENIDHYRVILDTDTKEYALESWFDKNITILSWDENIYKIPEYKELPDEDFDVILIRNKKTLEWTFKINWNIFHILHRSNKRIGQYTEFYVTRSNDANVLLHTIRFNTDFINDVSEVVVPGIDFDQPISVYCRKMFTSYAYIEK